MRDDVRTSREPLNTRENRVVLKTSRLVLTLATLSVLLTFLAPGCSRATAPGGITFIRLNQVGYESGPVHIYLMSGTAQAGSTFEVRKSNGETVFSGAVGNLGAKWGKYKVYPLDFTILTAGSYTLNVSGPHPASSTFSVDGPEQLYGSPLNNTLRFFQDQRDGSDYIPSALRQPRHT